MPKRVSKPKRKEWRYESKNYRAYAREIRLKIIGAVWGETMYVLANRPGFARRILARIDGKPLPEPLVLKPKFESIVPALKASLRPYNRNVIYPEPENDHAKDIQATQRRRDEFLWRHVTHSERDSEQVEGSGRGVTGSDQHHR